MSFFISFIDSRYRVPSNYFAEEPESESIIRKVQREVETEVFEMRKLAKGKTVRTDDIMDNEDGNESERTLWMADILEGIYFLDVPLATRGW